jgi:NAD(P)-dependent dehydrogenase (short-subunit alcohol dehydrogenase family)
MSRTGAFIVSGAGSGIGQAIATKIIENGHRVFGLGRDPRKLEQTARRLGAQNFSSSSVDLASGEETSRVTQEIHRWLQANSLPLLGVVNNAGVFDRVSFIDSSDAVWYRQFENNLLSAVRLTRDFYRDLKAGAPSSVLNISSTLGLRPVGATSAYSAIKAAMINWTEALALEWAVDGIRVNGLAPGIVDTPIHAFHGQSDDSEARKQVHGMQPLGVMGQPQDVAEAAWFLLSEKSRWTTGSVLSVDGGIHL